MLDQRPNFRVDNFVIAAAARGFFGQVDATVFVELVQPIDSIFGQIEGQTQGSLLSSPPISCRSSSSTSSSAEIGEGELDEWVPFLLDLS